MEHTSEAVGNGLVFDTGVEAKIPWDINTVVQLFLHLFHEQPPNRRID